MHAHTYTLSLSHTHMHAYARARAHTHTNIPHPVNHLENWKEMEVLCKRAKWPLNRTVSCIYICFWFLFFRWVVYCFTSTLTSLAIHRSHGLRGDCTSAEYIAVQHAVCFHCNGSGSMHIADDIYYSDLKLFWGRPTLCYSTSSLSTFVYACSSKIWCNQNAPCLSHLRDPRLYRCQCSCDTVHMPTPAVTLYNCQLQLWHCTDVCFGCDTVQMSTPAVTLYNRQLQLCHWTDVRSSCDTDTVHSSSETVQVHVLAALAARLHRYLAVRLYRCKF